MPYSSEILGRARQRLERENAERSSRYNARLEQAYREIPRLRQMENQMKRTMSLAVQSAFTGDTQKMAQAKKENEDLQKEWNSLVADHFPEGYLQESTCPHCGGLGYVGKQMCRCLEELCRQEQLEQVQSLACGQGEFSDFRLDYYSDRVDPKFGISPRALMEQNWRDAKRFAQQFQGNLLLVGGTGLGKTFLSACIATAVTRQGYSVTYESASRLFSNLEKDRFKGNEETLQVVSRYTQSDLLIIDDLGTELASNFVTSALYCLVNDRLLAGRPTVISTNLSVDAIRERYSAPIASRLQGNYQTLAFIGEDIRVLKNRGVLV